MRTTDDPEVFLASRMTDEMRELRAGVESALRRNGFKTWRAEAREGHEHPLDEQRLRCLGSLRAADAVVAILDGSHGSSRLPENGDLSILELELVSAALARRPLRIYFLDGAATEPRVSSLVMILRRCAADVVVIEGARQRALPEVIAADLRRMPARAAPSAFTRWFARRRAPAFGSLHDVEFLGGLLFGPAQEELSESLVTTLLDKAPTEPTWSERLVTTWCALRQLGFAGGERVHELRDVWARALSEWARCAAWLGLHGHFEMGRLAALNTLRRLAPDAGSASLHAGRGALASEYYSIALRVAAVFDRRRLLRSALEHVDAALASREADESGLLAIRGNVHLRLLQLRAGHADCRRVLDLRIQAHDTPARIGEAEVGLGNACLLLGSWRAAERHLSRGAELLAEHERGDFTVRAWRDLARLYCLTLRRAEARRLLDAAQELAGSRGATGQLEQLDALRRFWRL